MDRKQAVILDYLVPDKTPDLITYVRNFVHRNCFNYWNHHDRYVESSFELIKNAVIENRIGNVIQCNDYLLISLNNDKIKIRDYFSIYEIEITRIEINKFGLSLQKLIEGKLTNYNYNSWQFSYQELYIRLHISKDSEIQDEIFISHYRFDILVKEILKLKL